MTEKRKLKFTWIGKENLNNREIIYNTDFNYGECTTIKGIKP